MSALHRNDAACRHIDFRRSAYVITSYSIHYTKLYDPKYKGKVVNLEVAKYVSDTDFVVEIIERHVEKSKLNIKGAPIVVAGGYGMGSKENFRITSYNVCYTKLLRMKRAR